MIELIEKLLVQFDTTVSVQEVVSWYDPLINSVESPYKSVLSDELLIKRFLHPKQLRYIFSG